MDVQAKGGWEVTDGGPRTRDVADEVRELAQEVRDLGRRMTDGMAEMRTDLAGFRSGVESELKWIKRIGGTLAALVLAVVLGSSRVIWDAATIAADVRQHGNRLEKVEKRLDGLEGRLDGVAKQLDVLIRRTEPKAGG